MADFSLLNLLIVSFLLGASAGIIMHRSDFCLAGMFRDYSLFGDAFMLRSLLLLATASMVLFEAARLLHLLPLYPFPLLGPPSVANPIGGFIFGIGMVLAGGCVVGSLYKLGAGSFSSLVALSGIVIGSFLYAEIHPLWSAFSRAGLLSDKITLPQLLGISPTLLMAGLLPPILMILGIWQRERGWRRTVAATGYLQPWKAALLLSVIGCASWIFIGMPLGLTTAYAKGAALLASMVVPGHVGALEYLQVEALDFIHPQAGPLRGGAGPRFDAVAVIQFPLILGIVAGAAGSALRLKEWAWKGRLPLRQGLSALAGGILMGLAARMTPACNVWHLLGGLPILALQSILFLTGLLPGAWLGSRLLVRFVLR